MKKKPLLFSTSAAHPLAHPLPPICRRRPPPLLAPTPPPSQALLARTMGHAVGARSTLISSLSSIVYPAALLAYAHLLADGVLTLGVASKVLLLVVLATLAAKAALEGFHTLPQYCPRLGKRTLACFAGAFAAFPMPELFPSEPRSMGVCIALRRALWAAQRGAPLAAHSCIGMRLPLAFCCLAGPCCDIGAAGPLLSAPLSCLLQGTTGCSTHSGTCCWQRATTRFTSSWRESTCGILNRQRVGKAQ